MVFLPKISSQKRSWNVDKQVGLSPVACGSWGMGSNETAYTEGPQPVISNNLFTTITHNHHQPLPATSAVL